MIKIETRVHSIILLVGPSHAGKSTFAKNILIPKLSKPLDGQKHFKPNVQYISSDEIRQQLLGMEASKFDAMMTEVSDQTFKMLFTKLDLLTTYPINAEHIIVDTTGLSEEFRNDVLEIASKNNYAVEVIVFDYKNIDEYKRQFESADMVNSKFSAKVTSQHIKRLRTEVMKTLKSSKYRNITRLKEKRFLPTDIDSYEVIVKNYEEYEKNILVANTDWVIVGDVHGCIDELKELITKFDFVVEGNDIVDTEGSKHKGLIFIGDLIDKSDDDDLEATIRFVHHNMKRFGDRIQLVFGNHEDMVKKWLTDDPSLEKTTERYEQKERFYNTTKLLENNDALKAMFFEIVDNMKPFVRVNGSKNKSFIVTHAPCEMKFLGKIDKNSKVKQNRCVSRSKNKDKTNDELLPFLMTEAVNNHPLHIFGHFGQTNVRTFKNKVCIDTGCVYGFSLTGYIVNNKKPIIKSVKSKKVRSALNDFSNNLFSVETKKELNKVDINMLSDVDKKRLNYIVENGIGYISGTISPASKDIETNDLESLKSGLEYYKDAGVESVILEPKYMGSRAHVYLNTDLEKCYATSRNGYKIRKDLSAIFEQLQEKHKEFMSDFDISELVIDGELMPWAAIGEGLIDYQFRVIDKALESEISFLEENGFDEAFEKLVDDWKASDFESLKNSMDKKKLAGHFGHHYNNYKYIKSEFDRWHPISVHKEAWKVYSEQVELYGSQGEIHFKPFRILKALDSNVEMVDFGLNTEEQFGMLSTDSYLVVNFSDENYLEKARQWYENITLNEHMEGCVIKPVEIEFPRYIAPFLKVRNPKYLTIIYGYDMYFPKKFDKLFSQKNISKKVKISISEYHIGEELLKMDIKSDEFQQAIANFMFETEKEKGIDPRL